MAYVIERESRTGGRGLRRPEVVRFRDGSCPPGPWRFRPGGCG